MNLASDLHLHAAALGRLAQLVERLLYTQDVGGSSPSPPMVVQPWQEPSGFVIP
jgi:hypothetical protein